MINGKKYLIIFYEYYYPNKIKLIQYAGKFSDKYPCSPRAIGDIREGYYFYGIKKKSDDYMKTSYFITGEHTGNCFESSLSLRYKFYELEDIFCEKTIFDIFNYIIKNNELNEISNYILIKSTENSILIFSDNIYDILSGEFKFKFEFESNKILESNINNL